MPAASHKSATAFPVMATAPQPALASKSMSAPLQSVPAGGPELLRVASVRHAIGGGTVQVVCALIASVSSHQTC